VPTYQYACTACDHRFEQVQSFTDPTLTECPECSGRLRKLYGSVGVVFKGSGFYRTDSRAKSSAAASGSSEKSEKSSEKSEKKDSGGTKETTTSSSSSADKSPSTSSSSSTTTPAAKAS
jgi:putative FmdB family regulatory protein